MKKTLQDSLFFSFFIVLTCSIGGLKAQTKLIDYWNFNSTKFVSSPGDVDVSAVTVLATESITADYSTLDTNTAVIRYMPIVGTAASFMTYWDVTTGDTINERSGYGGCCTGTNNALRPRNPSDSMQLLWYIPTTNYQNIVITYETEATGSGSVMQNYSYSLDSGITYITTGLTALSYTLANTSTWTKAVVDLSSITAVNNTDKFIFRILFALPASGNASGNDRFDNITVEGDTLGLGITQSGVVLSSNSTTGNQWYKNGVAQTGVTGVKDTVTTNGAYYVEVAGKYSNTITIAIPATPTIAASGTNGAVLTSSSATGNQWYFNNTIITGATNQSYTATANGAYTVKVTSTGITAVSAAVNVTGIVTGIEQINSDNTFSVYPNPNGGNFTIAFNESVSSTYTLTINDMYGQAVYTETLNNFAGSYSKQINIAGSGVYTVSLTSATNRTIEKVVVY